MYDFFRHGSKTYLNFVVCKENEGMLSKGGPFPHFTRPRFRCMSVRGLVVFLEGKRGLLFVRFSDLPPLKGFGTISVASEQCLSSICAEYLGRIFLSNICGKWWWRWVQIFTATTLFIFYKKIDSQIWSEIFQKTMKNWKFDIMETIQMKVKAKKGLLNMYLG